MSTTNKLAIRLYRRLFGVPAIAEDAGQENQESRSKEKEKNS